MEVFQTVLDYNSILITTDMTLCCFIPADIDYNSIDNSQILSNLKLHAIVIIIIPLLFMQMKMI